jgi:hypothetical protein
MSRLEHRVDRLRGLAAVSEGAGCQHTAVIELDTPGRPTPKPRARVRCAKCGRLDEQIIVKLAFDPSDGR